MVIDKVEPLSGTIPEKVKRNEILTGSFNKVKDAYDAIKAIPQRIISSVGFCVFLLLTKGAFAQNDPAVYPYGGVPDKSRIKYVRRRAPLNFSTANFWAEEFHGAADFREAKFELAYFPLVTFHGEADFSEAIFHGAADFRSGTICADKRFICYHRY